MNAGLIIIPAYNEARNIEGVLKSIDDRALALDVLVVNDGSRDNTRELVQKCNVDVISHPFNLGYGSALQTGFKYSCYQNYDYIIQFDADGQHDPDDIELMMKILSKGDVDILIGSRFLGKGSFKAGLLKEIVISLMRFLIKIFTKTKITDPTSGLKGLSRKAYTYYSKMGNFPNDYPDADILIKMLRSKYHVSEIPINVITRQHGQSMHSGLKPIIYLIKILVSIMTILLSEKLVKEQ